MCNFMPINDWRGENVCTFFRAQGGSSYVSIGFMDFAFKSTAKIVDELLA